jgi:hypothetical protein
MGGLISAKDWAKTMESLEEYLRGHLGVTKIPLSYVIREMEAVPADPDPTDQYDSLQDEMIARTAIVDTTAAAVTHTPTYLTDRQRVWDLIAKLTRDQECWSYVKPAQRARDGRKAYKGLYDHYLGPNNVDNLATASERKLTTTIYNGEKRRWTFEKYVRVHVDQHGVLNNLKIHGYAGIDERSKVRHLVDGIKEKRLDTVKAQILSDNALRNDFDRCVGLYKDFIKQTADETRDMNISATNSSNNPGNSPGKHVRFKGNSIVEDRYYKEAEYRKLTNEQKKALHTMRVDRDGELPHKKRKKSQVESQLAKLDKRISKIAAAVTKKDDTDTASSSESDSEPTTRSNRKSKALTRQRKHKK